MLTVPCLLGFAIAAQAQEKPKAGAVGTEELQEVVVTGSRIARPDLDRLEPTTIVSAKTFDDRGYLDVGQALSELPSFGIQPSSAVNTQSTFGIAQSFVDLYSLGSQRTLTLVDGRRFVSSNSASLNGPTNPGQQVDLNVIPTKLIDRVETISVGGAPIYGADAIAGTVNIILKKDFQGVDVDVQAGVSDDKDAWNYRLRALAGQNFADGRGNITGVAEITKTDGLVGTSRRNFSQDLGFLAPATPGKYKTVLTPANSVPAVNFSGIPLVDDVFFSPPIFGAPNTALGVTNASGALLAFAPGTSALKPYNVGTQSGNPIFNSGGDGERLSQLSNILSPTERINLDTLGHFKINDSVNAFAEGWFSETHARNLISQPAYNTALFGAGGTPNGNFLVNINNPFLSTGDRTLIQNALNNYAATMPLGPLPKGWSPNQFYVARANTDLQSGAATATQVLARGVLGLNGEFSIGDRNFNWEVAGNYGSSSNTSVQPSYVFQNLQNALNSTVNAAGQIVCAGAPVNAPTNTVSSTCAPLNIFGQGSPSLAARQYITHLAEAQSVDTQRDFTANIGGDLFKLPAGEVKLEAGFENRRESAAFSPDTFYTQTLGQATITAVSGAYRTNEFYAETLIPIFAPSQEIPLLNRLELEGAARRVDNSIAGSATTWTEGMRWSPVKDVQFRANRTKSIRAPAVTELFLPSASSYQFANDPCDKNYVNQGTAPATRAANCKAAGINTANFVSNVVNATALGTTSGNANLASESADSRTVGIVLQPRWISRFNVSVDYVDIKLSSAIESLTLKQILDACYDSAGYPNNPSCTQFTRNGAGQITTFRAGYVNAGLLEFKGIPAAVDWTFDLPRALGSVQWRTSYLATSKLVSQVGSASPNNEAGSLGALGNTIAAPKGRGSVDVDYRQGPFSWNWQGLYYSGLNFDNNDTSTSKDILRVNPWWVINSTLSYSVAKNFTVRMIVDNVFDKEPPYPALAAGTGGNFASATTLYFSGIIGRTYLLSAEMHF